MKGTRWSNSRSGRVARVMGATNALVSYRYESRVRSNAKPTTDTCGREYFMRTFKPAANEPTLAERCHEIQRLTSRMEADLVHAVESACGPRASSDEECLRTDGYDNSLEVWGVGDIDLDAAAQKLKESGFGRVWLHQHLGRTCCKCPVR